MADAFRGLTIRLGADARPLNSAIASVKSSASQAQKQLTAMNKALKFDGTNVAAMGARIDLMGDKATLASRSVRDIRTAMSQASEATRRLASGTQNIYAETHKVRSSFNHVNASLQRIYDDVRLIVAEENGWALTSKELDNYMKKLKASYGGTTAEAKQLTKEMNLYLTLAHGAYGTGDAFGLQHTFTDAKKMKFVVQDLRSQSSALGEQLKELRAAEGFSAMKTQLIAWNAELRQSVTEVVRFKTELFSINAAPGVAKSTAAIERIDAALDDATASAKKMNQVFKSAPSSIEAAKAKLISEQHQTELLTEKIKEYKSILHSIESTGFDKTTASVRNVHLWVSKAQTACVEWGVKIEKVKAALDALGQRKADLEGVENKTKEAAAEFQMLEMKIEKGTAALVKMEGKADELNADLANANRARRYKQVSDDLNVASAAMTKATTKASALRRALNFAPTLRTMGYGLYSTLTPAITIAARYAIQSARNIDAAYRDMRKTVNGTEEEFEHLREAALEFSTTHFTSAEKILEIEAMGGQLGIAVSDLEAFSETISNLDVATNVDADTAAEQIGKMATVLGITVDEYDNFGDALVRLGNNMPVMESDVLTLTTRFMGMGKVVGMQPDEMLAWAAAASATGQKAEAAGSAMQRFIAKMETAVAGNGEELKQWAAVADMSAEDFASAFKEDASDAMYKFIEGLGRIQTEGDSVNQVLQELGINNVRDKQLLEGLAVQMANASDGASVLGEALRMSGDAYHGSMTIMKDGSIEEAGDAAREAAKKAEGFSGQIEMMVHDAQLLSQELAQGALPYVKVLAEAFKGATEAVKEMPQETKSAIVGLLGMAAAIGPLTVGFGAVGSAILTFMDIWKKALGSRTLQLAANATFGAVSGLAAEAAALFPKAAEAISGFSKKAVAAAKFAASAAPLFALLAIEVGLLVKTFLDANEANRKFDKATHGVLEAVSAANRVMYASKSDVEEYGKSVGKSVGMVEDLIETQNKLVDSMNERSEKAANEIADLKQAQEVLDKYMNTAGLTVAEQERLRNAIDLLNTKYGTHYAVVDAANGKIADEKGVLMSTSDAIDDYIEAKKRQIKAEELAASAVEIDKALDESVTAYVTASKEYQDYVAQHGDKIFDDYAVDEYGRSVRDTAAALQDAQIKAAEIVEADEEAKRSLDREWKALENATNATGNSIDALALKSSTLSSIFGDDTNAYAAFRNELSKVGLSVEDFSNITATEWGNIVVAWNNGERDLSTILSSMGISLHGATQDAHDAFAGVGLEFNDFVNSLGGNADELATKMRDAGGAATLLANVTKEQLSDALASSEGDIDTFIAKLQEFGAQNAAEVNVNANFDEANAAADEFSDTVENLPNGESEVDYSSYEEAEEQAEDTGEAIEDIPEYKSVTVNVNGNALSTLSSIKSYLDNLPSEKTVTVKTNEVKNASGGVTYGPIRAIPRHADGGINGIVTHPTLTNIGWVGEAGAEALLHMRHAGGAVIPLTNRRYVRPFARAVASEMMGGSTTNSYDYHITVNASGDGDDIARQVTKAIRAQELMRGRR